MRRGLISQGEGGRGSGSWYIEPAAAAAETTAPAGHAPSQASGPLGVTALGGKYDGAGVTVGVISDSFDLCTACSTHAAQDVASGNLPGPGNPYGDTAPVVVKENASGEFEPSDEGRAMLQLIYGLAPRAKLCFSTSGDTEAELAAAVTLLASASGGCHANIILDDVAFDDEPFFSDDIIAAAIDQVTAAGVVYISAAPLRDSVIYEGDFKPVSDGAARGGGYGNLQLSQVPAALTAGGFLNFAATGSGQISFGIDSGDVQMFLQWDDPFEAGKVTSDYNLLLFDSDGNYIANYSGIDSNFSTGEPFEAASFGASNGAPNQIAISLAATDSNAPARHLRLIANGRAGVDYTVSGLPAPATQASIFGHAAAAGAITASAFAYDNLSAPEPFIDPGPFKNYFDGSGNRLGTPDIRDTPVVAGVDEVAITFGIGGGTTGLQPFYGSSAGAATLAGVTALTLQASGLKATPAEIRSYLIQSGSNAKQWDDQAGYGYVDALRATTLAAGKPLGTTATTIDVSSSANPAALGTPVMFTAKVTTTGTASGNVTFYDGSSGIGSAQLGSMGTGMFTDTSLGAGAHSIRAIYAGDAVHAGSSSAVLNQTTSGTPVATTITLSSSLNPASAATTFVLTARVTSAGTTPGDGTLTFYDGTIQLGSVGVSAQGVATTKVYAAFGTHSYTAQYSGDTTHAASKSSVLSEVVNAITPTLTLTVLDPYNSIVPYNTQTATKIGLQLEVTWNAPGGEYDPTLPAITFYDGTGLLASCGLIDDEDNLPPDAPDIQTCIFQLPILSVGTHNISAVLASDGHSLEGTGTTEIVITPATLVPKFTLTSSKNPAPQGTGVTFTATVTGSGAAPTGTVTFQLNGNQVKTLAGAPLTFTTPVLAQGDYDLDAVYSGDNTYQGATVDLRQVIGLPASDKIAVISSANPAAPGANVTFSVNLSPLPSGNGDVFLNDGAYQVGEFDDIQDNGQASFVLNELYPGKHNITAKYIDEENADLMLTSAVLSQTITGTGAASTISIASSTNPTEAFEPTDLSAVVKSSGPTPTGTVTFLDESVSPAGNIAAYNLNNGAIDPFPVAFPATTSIVAVYSGDAHTEPSTSAVLVQKIAGLAPVSVSVTGNPNPAIKGTQVDMAIDLNNEFTNEPIPTGSVNIYDGTTQIGSAALRTDGSTDFLTSSLSVGTHTITVKYPGDASNGAGSGSYSQVVQAGSAITIALSTSPNPASAGSDVAFTVKIAATKNLTGTVTFYDGKTSFGSYAASGVGGTVTLSNNTLAIGTHSVTAVYSGDSVNDGATSNPISEVIVKDSSTTVVGASQNPVPAGGALTLFGTVSSSGTPTGTVTFLDGGKSIGAGVVQSNYVASLDISTLAAGTHSITASYSGDANTSASTSTAVSLVVTSGSAGATTTTLTASPNPAKAGASVTFTARLSSTGAVATGIVTFKDGGSVIGTANVGGGAASLTTTFAADGTNAITAAYSGDSTHLGSTSVAVMEVISGTTITATPVFSPSPGAYTTAQSVTIADATAGATIYYTTNGTTPTTASAKYTGAVVLSATETINAIAIASGLSNSTVATGVYTIEHGAIVADANTYVLNTVQGNIYIELRPDAAPKNVANFLSYVNSGAYLKSLIHRLVEDFVFQGGGYLLGSNNQIDAIPTHAAVVNEFHLSNVRGTLAMALAGSDINSATDQFFFNVVDNSGSLDPQKFTVIGQVVDVVGYPAGSLAVMDTIAADPVYDLSSNLGAAFSNVPLLNYNAANGVQPSNLVLVNSITHVSAAASAGLDFVPITPCRIADTRNAAGAFGAPEVGAGATRTFDVPQSACGIPASAVAYSLNVTVIPNRTLNYLTMWPAGQAQPDVSTLNSDGRIKANAAITPAGTNGGVSVYASDATHVILDIDGYFVPAGTASALAFYPLTPCRVADTRQAAGGLGGPSMAAGSTRAFPIFSSACGIPATAKAYSLNVTALPARSLSYLTTWTTGSPQPNVSTLNSSTGAIAANAAIVPAASNGDISIFVSDAANVILDINGYFAAPSAGGLSLYPLTPCRALDSRGAGGAFNGTLPVAIEGSACAPPSTAKAYVLNATVVPSGALNYLSLWPSGEAQPNVSTLNAGDGAVTSNMAIVPSINGSVDAFSSSATNLILDVSSYFAP